ncbi:hypothetical protein M413DRAFT_444291 [Hebeloma cylindrosporum]|uniref:Uncharacterized protein n=1 Tax=Hebeloma cylindrosporum TaxID=76867 RepID=A0A0C3C123_HEBCY|nr:hypothetical protein M413DRAFT_444291 [Hebeloma cylindrosporum h7]
MAITANSQALQFSAPSLIPNPDPVQLFEDTAWLWAPLFEDGEQWASWSSVLVSQCSHTRTQ